MFSVYQFITIPLQFFPIVLESVESGLNMEIIHPAFDEAKEFEQSSRGGIQDCFSSWKQSGMHSWMRHTKRSVDKEAIVKFRRVVAVVTLIFRYLKEKVTLMREDEIESWLLCEKNWFFRKVHKISWKHLLATIYWIKKSSEFATVLKLEIFGWYLVHSRCTQLTKSGSKDQSIS